MTARVISWGATTTLIQELGSSFFEEAMQQPEVGVALSSPWLNLNCVQH